MLKPKKSFVILSVILILVGITIRFYTYRTGSIMLFIGLLYLLLYYLAKTYKDLKDKSNDKFVIFFQLVMVLMSVVIFGKYMYIPIGYYCGLIIIPIFIILAVIFWIKARKGNMDLMIPSMIYFILTIPMFANFYDTPFENYYIYYYPQQYVKHKDIGINNSFDFEYFWKHNHNQNNKLNEEITALALQAHILANDEKRYEEAIEIYRRIITMGNPPDAYMYYQLSDCYIRIDQYDFALQALDSAIILEPTKAEYYNTRGWLYLNIKNKEMAFRDLEKSLQLNSTAPDTYLNLALVYYYLDNNYQKAYEAFKKAEFYNSKYTSNFSSFLHEIEKKLAQQ